MNQLSRTERRRQQIDNRRHHKKKARYLPSQFLFFEGKSYLKILILCVAFFIFYENVKRYFPEFQKQVGLFLSSEASYEEKMLQKGWNMYVFKPAQEIMPIDAVYMHPPQSVWLTIGNGAIPRYFLTPRREVTDNRNWVQTEQHVSHTFKLIDDVNKRMWPYFYVPTRNNHHAINTQRLVHILSLKINDHKVTNFTELQSNSDIINTNLQKYQTLTALLIDYGYKIDKDYWGENVTQTLDENTVIEADIQTSCNKCATIFTEVQFQNKEKLVFESEANKSVNTFSSSINSQGGQQIIANGPIQRLHLNDLHKKAIAVAQLNNWPTNNIKIVSTGINIGNPYPQLEKWFGIIEVERGQGISPSLKEKNLKNNKYYFQLAYQHKKENRINEALKYFEQAYYLYPSDPSPCFEIGDIYANQKNYDQALAWYQKAAKTGSYPMWSYFKIGNTYRSMKQYDQALEAYHTAGDQINNNKYAESVEHFFKLMQKNNSNNADFKTFPRPPFDGYISYEIGRTYEAMGNIEKAKKYYAFIAWGKYFSWDSAMAWKHLQKIAPDVIKIIPTNYH